MENQNPDIANVQIQISNNCTELENEILEFYWKHQDLEIKNPAKKVKKKYNLSQSDLNKLNVNYSTVSFYVLCDSCISYEKHYVTSHSKFNEILRLKKGRRSHSFKCGYCREREKAQAREEKERENEKLIRSLQQAIKNKNWNNLSNFERKLLVNCLDKSFPEIKKHYGKLLGQENFIKLIRALEHIAMEGLLVLTRNPYDNYITNFQYIKALEDHKDEINSLKQQSQSTQNFDPETNTLKLKLTINELYKHPDSPKYAGTVTFEEKIVIDPNVEYVFGAWNRANDNLYLTLTPTEELSKLPKQQRLSKQPISIRKGIANFLNELGENIEF